VPGGSCLARSSRRRFCGLGCDRAVLEQFRVVREKLLDRLIDQILNLYAAQGRGYLELSMVCFGNARAELGLGLGAAGGQVGIGCNSAAVHVRIRMGFLSGGHRLR
jgi:hypothetical protein